MYRSRCVRFWVFFAALWVALSTSSSAQTLKKLNPFADVPKVHVTLEHPPQLSLEIERVAFATAEGECADDFVDALISDFVSNGVEVIDRAHLEALLAEHEFSLSGVVDRESALELGRILGPTTLIFVKIRRCTTEKQSQNNHRTTYTGRAVYEYISKTIGYVKGSIQIVDLATARIHSARTVDQTVQRQNTSSGGQPAHPSAYDTIDAALQQATGRVHRLFFPWVETEWFPYFDDKDCNLKLAYNLIRANDMSAAIEQSETNLQACQAFREKKPKLVARAYYNLGVVRCLADQFDEGIEALNESLQLRPNEITSSALATCRNNWKAAEQMATFDAEATAEAVELEKAAEEDPSEELAKLEKLRARDLITQDIYAKKVGAIISRSGPPGETPEDQLASLKKLLGIGLISEELYERKVSKILSDL